MLIRMQPFGFPMFKGIFRQHDKFYAKTVMVKDNDAEAAMKILNKLMYKEGVMDIIRRTRFYEYPYLRRNRANYERCKAIYDEEMDRKISFVLRKNRADPYPGQ